MSFAHFTFTDDYKTEFKNYVDTLYKSNITEVGNKKAIIESLTESYFLHCGEIPESVHLDRLSTWLLKGENLVGDFHSEDQTRWRERKKETTVPEVFNDELSLKKEGHKVKKTYHNTEYDEENTSYMLMDFDTTTDKRKYNSPLLKYNTN